MLDGGSAGCLQACGTRPSSQIRVEAVDDLSYGSVQLVYASRKDPVLQAYHRDSSELKE